jgi:hypothetical protein
MCLISFSIILYKISIFLRKIKKIYFAQKMDFIKNHKKELSIVGVAAAVGAYISSPPA